ncbi:DNA-directed RNA polymerase subunit delta [Amphibacillus sp. Q70]|uniref:DNA-directed RNA polymerase subunit delta n=1 Tax=Amphibacillus sp. Q70 TaxID=3453416 RepID=UPI003F8261B5
MTLANLNREDLQEYSMIELAIIVLENKKKALNYKEIFDQISEMKDFSQTEQNDYLAQFYTDLNLDGRFLTLGAGEWGLKKWYSVDQIDEVIKVETTPKKRKKKKKKVKKEELEPSIDDQDEDLTEIPLDFVEAAYKNDEDEEDTITLEDEDLIEDEDFDDEYGDEEEEDEDEEDGEDEIGQK